MKKIFEICVGLVATFYLLAIICSLILMVCLKDFKIQWDYFFTVCLFVSYYLYKNWKLLFGNFQLKTIVPSHKTLKAVLWSSIIVLVICYAFSWLYGMLISFIIFELVIALGCIK